jgi:lytic murein transglycosylase
MILRLAAAFLISLSVSFAAFGQSAPRQDFSVFVKELFPDAQAKGVARETFDRAMNGLTPDQRVITTIQKQPEYGRPVGAYIGSIVSQANIANGQNKGKEFAQIFDAVEKKYGVDRAIILAIWGMETSYGAAKDKWDVFRSLSSLAYIRFREPYFRNELIVAMKIMQDGHIARENMVSSWAGAMGQTQFMPTNFVEYAVDFNGDGKKDIWNSVADVLGSTGNYLNKWKWKFGLPWGFEVTVPAGFDYRKSRASYADWIKLGVRRADGEAFPASGEGILFFPSGARGPGFIVTENFAVLKEYNNSDAYAIAVGHLADRIRGMGPIRGTWPKDDVQLSRDARVALQKKLASLGYKVNEFDAHIDFDLRDNIRAEQVKLGMQPDGHPTEALLAKLGIATRR